MKTTTASLVNNTVESSTRNTKAYKEISGGELCLLQKEVDQKWIK
jgi:hypothetical protein